MSLLIEITLIALVLSLLAVGGAIAMIPELYRIVVENRGWIDATTFNELFAIGQAAPGPNVLVIGLVAWKVAGVAAALLAILAFVVPTSVIAVLSFRRLSRSLSAERGQKVRQALAPISVALVASSAVLIGANLEGGWLALAIALGACLWSALANIHPLVPIALGAAIGAAAL